MMCALLNPVVPLELPHVDADAYGRIFFVLNELFSCRCIGGYGRCVRNLAYSLGRVTRGLRGCR